MYISRKLMFYRSEALNKSTFEKSINICTVRRETNNIVLCNIKIHRFHMVTPIGRGTYLHKRRCHFAAKKGKLIQQR